MNGKPNPGSWQAEKQGCTCPVIDNHHGTGILMNGMTAFWISETCPLHADEIKVDLKYFEQVKNEDDRCDSDDRYADGCGDTYDSVQEEGIR